MSDDINPFFDEKERGETLVTENRVREPTPVAIDDGIRYINIPENSDGWVNVKKSNNQIISVCAYTKTKLLERKDSRIYFKILDGRTCAGEVVSMSAEGALTYLKILTRSNDNLILHVTDFRKKKKIFSKARNQWLEQRLGQLDYGSGKCQVILTSDDSHKKVPPGEYTVGSPDYAHSQDMTAQYRKDGKKHNDAIWFPIIYGDNSHYIHVGNLSHGCVTVYSIDDWDKVYEVLIKNRTDDEGLFCAKIKVAFGDLPE